MDKSMRYQTGYMKDRGGSCAKCNRFMQPNTLYLAIMMQSRRDDCKYAVNYHLTCFFKAQRLRSEADIGGFERIRQSDQDDISKQIAKYNNKIVAKGRGAGSGKGSKKRSANEPIKMSKQAIRDFGIEYSKSGRAQCCGCRQKIANSVVRCKKVVYDTEVGMKYGGQPLWHHFDCFVKLKIDLGWYGGADQLPGFNELDESDQQMVTKQLNPSKIDEIPELKKSRLNAAEKKDETIVKTILQRQNEKYFEYRDAINQNRFKGNWIEILQHNSQTIPKKSAEILDAVADMLTFGALKPCPLCDGQLVLDKFGYSCTGNISEWARCDNHLKEPERVPCQLTAWFCTKFPRYDGCVENRAFKTGPITQTAVQKYRQNDIFDVKVQREKPPLYQMEISAIGKLSRTRDQLKPIIEKMGGKMNSKIHALTMAILSTEAEVEKMNQRMTEAKNYGIHIVTDDFLNDIQDGTMTLTFEYLKKNSICDWGTEPELRLPIEERQGTSKIRSIYTKSIPKNVTLKIVDGTAVDPASGLQDAAIVYIENDEKYSATLSLTDIQSNQNSFYKLQILESHNRTSYWLFTSWGRIGTNIGDTEMKMYNNVVVAQNAFRKIFKEKTGNNFGVKHFKKKPGKYILVDVDYSDNNIKRISDSSLIPSKLDASVQNLMKLIFDVEMMRNAMVEFNLDMNKMPLGKLSRNQLSEALTVLRTISKLIETGGRNSMFVGASNHFYSLIPHDFGIQCPPVIDTIAEISAKQEMIEMLIQLEIAVRLLQADTDATVCPLDSHYDQLKTNISPVGSDTEEYSMIQKYLRNTHGDTHNFKLQIEDMFKINRDGEQKRFEPFRTLHNRKLLWHGSRTANYVGIISNGLRIAPPEAPSSGYMFGKGIYFADMVSKSANYCWSQTNGLLLLCEVALGNMYECTRSNHIVQLPKDKHSTKGIGRMYPNAAESVYLANGVEIPMGKPVNDLSIRSELLYNEYIVYDAAQVNIKYLLKVKFNH